MNFREGISVKSLHSRRKHFQRPQLPYHLQPLQSLYQNEDNNLRINFYNYIEVRFIVDWPESSSKVSVIRIFKA